MSPLLTLLRSETLSFSERTCMYTTSGSLNICRKAHRRRTIRQYESASSQDSIHTRDSWTDLGLFYSAKVAGSGYPVPHLPCIPTTRCFSLWSSATRFVEGEPSFAIILWKHFGGRLFLLLLATVCTVVQPAINGETRPSGLIPQHCYVPFFEATGNHVLRAPNRPCPHPTRYLGLSATHMPNDNCESGPEGEGRGSS